MSRLARRFQDLSGQGRTALVPYLMAGDPEPEVTVELMHAMVDAGADIIELGMPFSDPIADGPVIQQAAERALSAGMTLGGVTDMVARFREKDSATPVIVMGYLNPVERMGGERFVENAARAGVDGVLIVDLPPEEAGPIAPLLRDAGLDPIFLVSPTTEDHRLRTLCREASGFVYYVSLKGVTGAGGLDLDSVAERLALIRAETDLPVGVGFGVRDAETARRVAGLADAVVVGSAVVQRIADWAQQPEHARDEVMTLLGELRSALDEGRDFRQQSPEESRKARS